MDPILRTAGRSHESTLPCNRPLIRAGSCGHALTNSEEKHEPVSDIDTVVVDSLKALDPEWPIREADIVDEFWHFWFVPIVLQKSFCTVHRKYFEL